MSIRKVILIYFVYFSIWSMPSKFKTFLPRPELLILWFSFGFPSFTFSFHFYVFYPLKCSPFNAKLVLQKTCITTDEWRNITFSVSKTRRTSHFRIEAFQLHSMLNIEKHLQVHMSSSTKKILMFRYKTSCWEGFLQMAAFLF